MESKEKDEGAGFIEKAWGSHHRRQGYTRINSNGPRETSWHPRYLRDGYPYYVLYICD
jgi:hypothetical protein